MPEDLVAKTMIPMMIEKMCSAIFITTISDPDNHVTRMINMVDKHTNRPLFHTIRLTPTCASCLAKGIIMDCPHGDEESTPWIGSSKRDMAMQYYAQMGMNDIAKMELFSISVGQSTPAFDAEPIQRFVESLPYSSDHPPSVLFMGIDPSGGGDSLFAITTIYFVNQKVVVRSQYFHSSISPFYQVFFFVFVCERDVRLDTPG